MSEIPVRPTGELDDQGDPILARVMTPEEIIEREVLNRDNTAPRLRARVLAAGNGRILTKLGRL